MAHEGRGHGMRIVGEYSFDGGDEVVKRRYPRLLKEIETVIKMLDAAACGTKKSREKTMPGRLLLSPRALNKAFKAEFNGLGWLTVRVPCEYSAEYYVGGKSQTASGRGAFREMDFVKDKLGVEVQFCKCDSMVCSVCAKMTIFHNLGYIDTGVEIVPVKAFADEMSTGVSYFEQFTWDLDKRGVSNIDIPVLVLGITASG